VPPETIAELHASGLFHALQPSRFGGHEAELVDFIDVVDLFAGVCASTAWVYGVLTSHSVAVATYPEDAQDEVWGKDGNALSASSFVPTGQAVPVEGGFRITGTWPFASACDYAQWALLGGVAENQGAPPTILTFLVRMTELTILDDWDVLGLAGTGSKSLVAKDVFVPARRALPFAQSIEGTTPGGKLNPHPLYRCPRHSCTPAVLAIVPVGVARGAIDAFADYATRKSARRGGRLADQEQAQLKVSECEAEVDAARLLLRRNCIENLATIRASGTLTLEQRARNRRDHAYAVKLALQAVDRLMTASGAHGLYADNPMQRYFRDAHAAAAHIALNWDASGRPYGQFKLGVPPTDPFL
jgi:alkylation response protein AidB-like acyl-CoA dehydrogenase